jgi:hypothetical protein
MMSHERVPLSIKTTQCHIQEIHHLSTYTVPHPWNSLSIKLHSVRTKKPLFISQTTRCHIQEVRYLSKYALLHPWSPLSSRLHMSHWRQLLSLKLHDVTSKKSFINQNTQCHIPEIHHLSRYTVPHPPSLLFIQLHSVTSKESATYQTRWCHIQEVCCLSNYKMSSPQTMQCQSYKVCDLDISLFWV